MIKKIILILLLLPQIVFAENGEMLDKVVAIVNDNIITATELNVEVEMMRRQIISKNMQIPTEEVLKKQVLQHLIDINLQLQLAKNNNLIIDNSELDETLQNLATNNHITLEKMRDTIKQQGLEWETFRENIRKEILISRVQQKAVASDIVISTQQVEDYLKTASNSNKLKKTYHVQNIVIPLTEEPTTEQLKKAEKKVNLLLAKLNTGADFTEMALSESSGEFALEGGDLGERNLAELPEIFANKVVDMQIGEIAGPLRTGNGLQIIKLVFIGGANGQHQVVKAHVRHILLRQDANMTAKEAETQIYNLYQQLLSGKEFSLMAKQHSMDAASSSNGGDLGWVSANELVAQFADAMSTLALNTVSKPVQTQFGWHLIEVLERKTVDDSKAFEQQQVKQFLFQRKFTEAVQHWQQHLRADAYVNILDKELA